MRVRVQERMLRLSMDVTPQSVLYCARARNLDATVEYIVREYRETTRRHVDEGVEAA